MSAAPHRRRRILAGVMAAMLCASVLAVVAGSPAQAANTSRELLVDTNSDGVGDAREFGGRDRYDTARRLTRNFAAGKGGLGKCRLPLLPRVRRRWMPWRCRASPAMRTLPCC